MIDTKRADLLIAPPVKECTKQGTVLENMCIRTIKIGKASIMTSLWFFKELSAGVDFDQFLFDK